jgi:uncharacterized protein YacL
MQFEVITNAYDNALRARLIQQGKPVAYETHILCSANHTTNKDVSSCVCTQVFVLLSGGYKLHSVKVLHFLTQPLLQRGRSDSRSSFLSLIISLIISLIMSLIIILINSLIISGN